MLHSTRIPLRPATAIDRDSLKLMIERSVDATPFKVRRQHERLDKAYARGQLYIPPNETEEQRWWRCEARMMLGDYTDWSGWEYRDEWAATLWHHRPYPVPPWNGLQTDTLFIIGEQGIGDEVFFASCLHECRHRARRVIVEVTPRLVPVIERMGYEARSAALIEDGLKRAKQPLPEGTTAWMALADLPRMWRRSRAHFARAPAGYITADPAQAARFEHYRGRTGVSWRGAQGTVPLAQPGMLSLQYDQLPFEHVERPVDLTGAALDLRNDIEGVLGLVSVLANVVSVSTSVAHFAAALGVPTTVHIADPSTARRGNIFPFKWVCRATPGRTPWYPGVTVVENSAHNRSLPRTAG